MEKLIFTQQHQDAHSRARNGTLALPHGLVQTPAFMPVGTNATVKAVPPEDLQAMGFKLILANTYHLYLRPGHELIRSAGGLHGFSGWNGNFLTDSGGFQVFSLAPFRKITDDGVKFRSHIDGSTHFLTPEKVVEIQTSFNSDIQMQLDICSPWGEPEKKAMRTMYLTLDWGKRAKAAWLRAKDEDGYQGQLFGIIQGNFSKELRKISANETLAADFPGLAIGGLSVGEPKEVFCELLDYTASFLPQDKPRYLMGIGTPDYILEAIHNGIDLFDCVYPTRTARNGLLFTSTGQISIKKSQYAQDFGPIDPECRCPVCLNHSRAYLHHLYRNGEILYSILATRHNLSFLADLVRKARLAISEDRFEDFRSRFLAKYQTKENCDNSD
ncbi:MAG TPA: tRNA guanosine(34) transglycosylase Tgt [Spirochaetales bacterium]|nr:tRNA guanosine(34) transglycosylase Tgt [Spirochaetales bacterium]